MPLFSDTFTGSGSMSGHAPDVRFSGYPSDTWTTYGTSPPTLTGSGGLHQTSDSNGYAYYGAMSSGGPYDVRVDFSITTASSGVNTGVDRGYPLYFYMSFNGGLSRTLWLQELSTGWDLSDSVGNQTVTLANSTTYTGWMKLLSGVFTWSFLGESGSQDLSGTPSAYSGGIAQLRLRSTPGIVINEFVVSDASGNPGTINVNLPAVTATLAGTGSAAGAALAITLPKLTARMYGAARAVIGIPLITVHSTGRTSTHDNALDAILPSITAQAQAGANASIALPPISAEMSATFTGFAEVSAALPSIEVEMSGTTAAVGSAEVSLPVFDVVGYSGSVCSVTIGPITAVATATAGGVASAAVTLPLFEIEADATAQNYGSANIVLPALQSSPYGLAWLTLPGFKLTAIGTATITATYEAYAVNLKHSDPDAVDETTRYTNFPFTHVVRYKNSYYGANSTGLYLLEGTTDDGAAIPFDVKTAMTDFKSSMKKTLASAYFSGRFGPASTITLTAGEGTPVAYSFSTPRGQAAQNHRQVFGKGLKERYYALEVAGTGTLELDGIEMDVAKLSRRI